MFLTRFRVNTARSEARLLLGSPHRVHGAVTQSFPAPPARDSEGPRVLWRVDYHSRTEVLLYITSPDRPDLTHLVEQAGWPKASQPGWQTYDYAAFLDKIVEGDTCSFRLTANPVHSIRRNKDEPTKRTAHVTSRYQTQWLVRQQEKAGFSLVEIPEGRRTPGMEPYEVVVRDKRYLRFTKNDRETRQNSVTLATATYEGRLCVTSPDAFRKALTRGLGKAKAYGCGLMTLEPVR